MTPAGPRTAQVVPDIATFAVDDGFRYRIPEDMDVGVGSRVRIRVSGRRLRGYVTAVFDDDADGLVDIDGVVGTLPSFSDDDLPLLRWCATHYVTPLSTVLKRTVPPNVPRVKRRPAIAYRSGGQRTAVIVGAAPHTDDVARLIETIGDEESALVLVPTTVEAETLASSLGDRAQVAHSSLEDKATTAAWSAAANRPGTILVGTREAVLWPVAALSHIIVVEDSRRVMKSPSTPTFGVREIATRRARAADIPLTFITPLPSLETLAIADQHPVEEGRSWGLVEIVDRTDEPPTPAVIIDRTRAAIVTGAQRGWDVFVLVPRRGYARAVRCGRCGQLRVCQRCDAALAADGPCVRCGTPSTTCVACGSSTWQGIGAGIGSVVEDLRRSLGRSVGTVEDRRPVTVGTERDLLDAGSVDLAVAVDLDTVARAPTYRAAEDALRLGVRLSHLVTRGSGRRTVVQTSDPGQPVVDALRSGRWTTFMDSESGLRRAAAFPPYGELLALEVADAPDDLDSRLRSAVSSATIMGPATMRDRTRWLLQGADLTDAKVRLRPLVRTLRDAGHRVRVDVDPIDL